MLALLVPVGVMLLVAFLVHKQKVRNGENGLPYLGLLFDTIAPYDPSTPYCTPPSSPTSLELSNMRTVEPSKSPSATLQLLPPAVQFELPTSPSVDDQPAAFAADVTLAPAALPPIFPTHPVNHTRKEKFDIGGLQSTAPGPELLSTTDLIRLGDSVKAAESFGDFQTKIGDSEEPRAPLVPALASLEQKASSKHHHHRQEGEAALRSEDGDLSQQPNVGVEQSLGLVESSSDLKIETEEARLQMKSTPTPDTANHKAENTFASKTTIKESTEETAVGTTNERQLSGHHSFRSSSDYLHYRKSKDSIKSPKDGASSAAVLSGDVNEPIASVDAPPLPHRHHHHHHRCRSRSMSGHRSSQRSSSHRRSKTAEEGSSAVRHSSRSLHDGVSAAHDSLSQYTNEAAGPSDRQPRRHHHHRSASCRHRSHRSSSSVRRQSKRKDVADGSEPIDDLSRPLDQGPVADPSEQQDARQ